MMRILGGELRGRRLRVPRTTSTRPSTGRLREALFSVLQGRLPGADVVDLFAGSGSLGLEAISRGARSALFVELDRSALKVLRDNVEKLAVQSNCRIRQQDALRWMHMQRQAAQPVDLVLADPPYAADLLQHVLPLASGLVECGSVRCFCLEHEAGLSIESSDSIRMRTRRYGHSAFTLMEGAVE